MLFFEAIFILVPKTLLWLGVTRSGVHYLMETAGIMNVVVNAMALSFILNAPWLSAAFCWGLSIRKIPTSQLVNVSGKHKETKGIFTAAESVQYCLVFFNIV